MSYLALKRRIETWLSLLIGLFGALILKLLALTLRVEMRGDGELLGDAPHILTLWHRRILPSILVYPKMKGLSLKGLCALISAHRDGRSIATACKILGITSASGSSTRGGQQGLIEMRQKLKDGYDLAITPDGPKGPPFQVKPGVVALAQNGGALICPLAVGVERAWVFNSWDRMILPKPFSKVISIFGPVINLPAGIEFEDAQQIVKEALDALEQQIERELYV